MRGSRCSATYILAVGDDRLRPLLADRGQRRPRRPIGQVDLRPVRRRRRPTVPRAGRRPCVGFSVADEEGAAGIASTDASTVRLAGRPEVGTGSPSLDLRRQDIARANSAAEGDSTSAGSRDPSTGGTDPHLVQSLEHRLGRGISSSKPPPESTCPPNSPRSTRQTACSAPLGRPPPSISGAAGCARRRLRPGGSSFPRTCRSRSRVVARGPRCRREQRPPERRELVEHATDGTSASTVRARYARCRW